MDSYEATRMVYSRIHNLDPENASKIIGYLLIQDHGEKEMIRLAFGPEALIHATVVTAKTHLGLLSSSNPPTPSTPSSPSPFSSRPRPLSIPASTRLNAANNGGFDITNPSSPFSHLPMSPSTNSPLSYASIVNGANNIANGPGSLPSITNNCNENEFADDYQLQDHLSFLKESKAEDLFDPRLDLAMSPTGLGDSPLHRRSFSVPGMCFGSEDVNSGLGWKPCLYFARGFCKNGTSCRFLHGDCADGGASAVVGSPSNLNEFEQCQELLRSKALQQQQQQKLASASQFMAAGASFPYNKCLNFLLQQQNETQRSAAPLMMGDELLKFGRSRLERNDFSSMGLGGMVNPGSRQIYLTFPADSTFREEDVSNYFSIYGPVQDVRIPYQQKRMFGFVTFVYPETVKIILAKGNPHFVCDSRVLVKPYKEKGKVQDKKQQHQQQQLERGEYSACSSPSGLDSRDAFDLQLGARMFYNNTQEVLLRRKLEEQADLQQAIELQGRRLRNLQLLDFKNHQFHHGLSTGSPVPSPTVSLAPNNHALVFPVDGIDQEALPEENGGSTAAATSQTQTTGADADKQLEQVNPACNHYNDNGNINSKGEKIKSEESDLPESLDHILPDNLFASPKKSTSDHLTAFSTASVEVVEKIPSPTTSSSGNNNPSLAPLNSCFLQMPRISSGHGTIGM
ncbi:hypothetical protein SLA2020_244820 [Shorea laevis]